MLMREMFGTGRKEKREEQKNGGKVFIVYNFEVQK